MKLSTTYSVLQGDTFDIISSRSYGHEGGASNIRNANPGVSEPLLAGTQITIPVLPGAPTDRIPDTAANGVSEVSIVVGTEVFRFWNAVSIVRSVDSFDQAGFSAPFDVDTPGFKEFFRPFSYKPFGVDVAGRRLFTGTLMGIEPDIEGDSKVIRAAGYATPGVLQDCTAPSSAYPLQFIGQNLRQIATTLAGHFGVDVVFDDDPGGSTFNSAPRLDEGKKVLSFLIGLAKQKGFLITNTPEGELFFRKADVGGKAVATLRQGDSPLMGVTPVFRPQEYYSHVTGIGQSFYGFGGGNITVPNPRLKGVTRPFTFKPSDAITAADITDAVNSKIGRMFASAAAYTAQVSTWHTPGGGVWADGDTVSVHAPDAMIYEPYDFVIRQVTLDRTAKKETATLSLVLPGSLASKIPERMPWDD